MSVSLTERAAIHVRNTIERRGKGLGIRVGVKTSGCSGLAYALLLSREIEEQSVSRSISTPHAIALMS